MQNDRLVIATQSMQAGKMEEARALLELVLKEDRNHIKAWQLYAETWKEGANGLSVINKKGGHLSSAQV